MRSVLLDRVVDWYKAEVVATAGKGKRKGTGSSTRQAARGGDRVCGGVGGAAEEAAAAAVVAAGDAEGAERFASVWALLAKTGDGDAHKCLKKVGKVVLLARLLPFFFCRS